MMKPKYEWYMPWTEPPLDEWSIVGMNHYTVQGQKSLFVAMTRDGQCIIAEGPSDELVFINLKRQANRVNQEIQSDSEDQKMSEFDKNTTADKEKLCGICGQDENVDHSGCLQIASTRR